MGKESVRIGGDSIQAWVFELTGEGFDRRRYVVSDDRRLLVQLQSGPSGLGGRLVVLDLETARTTPVDAPDFEDWEIFTDGSSLRTLVGFRNETEADIWLAKGSK